MVLSYINSWASFAAFFLTCFNILIFRLTLRDSSSILIERSPTVLIAGRLILVSDNGGRRRESRYNYIVWVLLIVWRFQRIKIRQRKKLRHTAFSWGRHHLSLVNLNSDRRLPVPSDGGEVIETRGVCRRSWTFWIDWLSTSRRSATLDQRLEAWLTF